MRPWWIGRCVVLAAKKGILKSTFNAALYMTVRLVVFFLEKPEWFAFGRGILADYVAGSGSAEGLEMTLIDRLEGYMGGEIPEIINSPCPLEMETICSRPGGGKPPVAEVNVGHGGSVDKGKKTLDVYMPKEIHASGEASPGHSAHFSTCGGFIASVSMGSSFSPRFSIQPKSQVRLGLVHHPRHLPEQSGSVSSVSDEYYSARREVIMDKFLEAGVVRICGGQVSAVKEEGKIEREKLGEKISALIATMVVVAKDLGRYEGLLVGSVAEVDVQTHPYFDPQDKAKLVGANGAFDDTRFSVLKAFAGFGKEGGFEGLKAFFLLGGLRALRL
ncbi:hypothetical protein L1987_23183 [Smallanthus sonchifolius]|uniref:Uncharacterized protein n=1 Tax=Smallanthus sonchifolius TaxID=185202 RepID=A0ACB9IIA6_9ASTR|nr:hypothetical protein L1987_23183 [Smallanthus sonchifolius]